MFAGTSPDDHLVEVIELPTNKFFVAAQYHPEFLSRPNRLKDYSKHLLRLLIISMMKSRAGLSHAVDMIAWLFAVNKTFVCYLG